MAEPKLADTCRYATAKVMKSLFLISIELVSLFARSVLAPRSSGQGGSAPRSAIGRDAMGGAHVLVPRLSNRSNQSCCVIR
jgi:hypothetical protein